MHARGCDAEEALHVRLRWRAAVDLRVGVDEREVLTLRRCEALRRGEFVSEGIDKGLQDAPVVRHMEGARR